MGLNSLGLTKSQLYESTLNFFDFDIPDDKTTMPWDDEIENIKIDEREGKELAAWYEDVDGKLIVDGLLLKDPFVRVQITKNGFSIIPIASRRAIIAKKNQVKIFLLIISALIVFIILFVFVVSSLSLEVLPLS